MQLNLSSGSQPALGLNMAVPLSNLKKAFCQSAGSGVALPGREMFIWAHHSWDGPFCKTSVFMKSLSAPEVPVPLSLILP